MAKIYYEADANLDVLKTKQVAVIGFGSQGHAHALNLHESGIDVVVGELPGSPGWQEASQAGLAVVETPEAVKRGDLVIVLLADEHQPAVYSADIEPNLKKGAALMFAHGFNIHFGQITPPAETDVFMVAPKGPGHIVRRMYTEGIGVPALLAVYQDFTGEVRQIGLAYAKGIGAAKAGVIETTFKEETETDLFGEQAVLCGGTSELVKAGFDTLVEAGYQPEIAYFECLHELKLIVDLIYERGISGMRYSISNTAEYGDLTMGKKIINEETRESMRRILVDIQSGRFAKDWVLENRAGYPTLNAMRRQESEHLIEKVGRKLRDMMDWIKG